MFGTLGMQETVFIFILALLLFGPKKLPELGRTIAKAIAEFRRASSELKATFDREMKSLEQETQSLKEITSPYQNDTYNYDYSSYESGNYEGSYGSETYDSTAANSSTASASATEGAESSSAVAPEGTIAYGEETAAATESGEASQDVSAPGGQAEALPTTAEHNA